MQEGEVSDSQSTSDAGNSEQMEVALQQKGKAGGLVLENNKQDTNTNGARATSSMFLQRPTSGFCGIKMARVYAVSLYILIVLSVIFVSLFKCPSFRALHS